MQDAAETGESMPSRKFGLDRDFSDWTQKMHDIMDEMLKRTYVHFRDSGVWQPAVNVYETPDAFLVGVELAGLDEKAIHISCDAGNRLQIRGVRPQPRPAGASARLGVLAMEIDEGGFERTIELPEAVRFDGIEANYSKGLLWIRIPRMTP